MPSRRLAIIVLGLVAASLAGTALASAGWRLGLGALTLAAAGAFSGLLDGIGPASTKRTILVLGVLTYLVLVPVLGFAERGLEERGGAPGGWWLFAAFGVAELAIAFVGARRWQSGRAPGPAVVAAVTR